MIEIGFAIGACSPIARPVITGVGSDLPEIDSTTTGFAPEVAKEDADEASYGEKFAIEPPYLSNDNTGTTQTVNNPVTNPNTKHVATKVPPRSGGVQNSKKRKSGCRSSLVNGSDGS